MGSSTASSWGPSLSIPSMAPSANRTSLSAVNHACASVSDRSNRPPSAGSVRNNRCPASRLASIISGSYRLRNALLSPLTASMLLVPSWSGR
ncbi:Uncharacterised protein [Mycobacteroides abscessus subsp. abscessus]|nr:Uncharacterised protein [Mycobacteroides abscessus subsp. abscessus]